MPRKTVRFASLTNSELRTRSRYERNAPAAHPLTAGELVPPHYVEQMSMSTQPIPITCSLDRVAALQENVEKVISGKSEVIQFCIAALLITA